ncbi:hypothetical protein [Chryseobacterium sp. MP_3.2]|uniref:hypothetical protein n=1 Tax=Chryseobacterium sp. MP_3.2 TaxID=3071712 RepID=UPI002DFE43F9|nr:hypothetical protein [Chryseobacterium sp. MP_3.2]
MKISVFILLIIVISCEKKTKSDSLLKDKNDTSVQIKPNVSKNLFSSSSWFKHYQEGNPDFKREKFSLEETAPIQYQETSVVVLNEKGFKEIYKPFLIFNESKSKYIDLDSYHWFPNSDGNASFEADQQIVLVDYFKKEAQQIAYFGPSYTIEDAYWKGDSIAVLLGNSYEKVPFIFEYNFPENTFKYFKYSDTLQFTIPYSEVRLKNKGINLN